MKSFARNNGLTLALLALFLFSVSGQFLSGFAVHNEERGDRKQPPIALSSYIVSGHFVEALFENWQSEWLQMATYVTLTIYLRQKGSHDSKEFDNPQEDEPPDPDKPDAPSPLKRGGVGAWLYRNSLTLALLSLFIGSVALHAVGGAASHSEDLIAKGEPRMGALEYMTTSHFWFQSFQNWQSEFLSIAALVTLGVYLRQQGSTQSKRVDDPHDKTGK